MFANKNIAKTKNKLDCLLINNLAFFCISTTKKDLKG